MKKLDSNEYFLCRMQGKLFAQSLEKSGSSSPVFIRRFMNSTIAKAFDDKSILFSAMSIDNILELLDEEFGKSAYGKIKYGENELYWIGYIYRVMCFYYDISSKVAFNMFHATEIVKLYNIGHTFDPEDAVERFMESKNFDFDYTKKGVEILKRLTLLDKLTKMIGTNVKVFIDRPIGYNHNGIIYTQNYGYIKEITALDGEYQDAYVIGIDYSVDTFDGKVIAIINRKEDIEEKIVVCSVDKDYTNEEIENAVGFQEQYFKHKIIRKALK